MMETMEKDLDIIRSLQLSNKLTIAGGGDYDKIWIRDNVYVALALIEAGHEAEAAQIYSELITILKSYKEKLDLGNYPQKHELLHARFSTDGAEVDGEWGNKQHDAIGLLLFGIGRLRSVNQKYFDNSERELVQKIVHYLENCHYWEDPDNGIWEEDPALHASSLAACIKGIEAVSGFCSYTSSYLELAKKNLDSILPTESLVHTTDMALLTLVWPLGYKQSQLVKNVEEVLLRKRGVARYIGDRYEANGGQEPAWTMGIPWLGIAYFELGDIEKARYYLEQTEKLYTDEGLPESYVDDGNACIHTPLAWSHAIALVLREKLRNRAE